MKINCEKNYIDNETYWEMHKAIYNTNFHWCKRKNLFEHRLIEEENVVSTQVDLLKPFREKVKKDIIEAVILLIPKIGEKNVIVQNIKPLTCIYNMESCNGLSFVSSFQEIKSEQNKALFIDYPTSVIQKRQSDKDYNCMFYILFKNK
tara:strand:+ start:2626 stop:3069 length:444 start_codon:yes stop_codon:yes gene_type:complete